MFYINKLMVKAVPQYLRSSDNKLWRDRHQSLLYLTIERRMTGNCLVRCGEGENSEIISKNYLSRSTVLKIILYIYTNLYDERKIAMAAPTGRAGRRMYEATGHESSTLHSLLGLFSDSEDSPALDSGDIDADFIIVDESSMIDMFLAYELFTKIKLDTKVLLVGDADQLPSIEPGNVFRELIKSDLIAKTVLNVIYRQDEKSHIPQNAQMINSGGSNLRYGDSFEFIECENEEKASEIICDKFMEESQATNIYDLQILTPMRERGKSSSKELNENIRELINPMQPPKRQVSIGKRVFRTYDKVMQIKNKPPVFNGDIGKITKIHRGANGKEVFTIDFEGRIVEYTKESMDNIVHAYSTTIHKSQGSEFSIVIIPLFMSHYIMLQRNLIYTAITRAKDKVILVGEKKALYKAIGRNEIDTRNTRLCERLAQKYELLSKSRVEKIVEQLKLNA